MNKLIKKYKENKEIWCYDMRPWTWYLLVPFWLIGYFIMNIIFTKEDNE